MKLQIHFTELMNELLVTTFVDNHIVSQEVYDLGRISEIEVSTIEKSYQIKKKNLLKNILPQTTSGE